MLCQKTGFLFEAEDLQRTNPTNQHFEDCCAWAGWGTIPGKTYKAHVYSWDQMALCVRGFSLRKDGNSIEVVADRDPLKPRASESN